MDTPEVQEASHKPLFMANRPDEYRLICQRRVNTRSSINKMKPKIDVYPCCAVYEEPSQPILIFPLVNLALINASPLVWITFNTLERIWYVVQIWRDEF